MPVKLYLCPFGFQGATRLLFQEAAAGQRGNDYSWLTYIAPAPRKVRSAQLEFAETIGTAAFIPPWFVTLNQFARQGYAQIGTRRRLDPELRALLIARLLPGFGLPRMSLGYARAIADFIKALADYCPQFSLTELKEQVQTLMRDFDRPRAKVLQAIEIRERYERLLEEKGWIDDGGIIAAVAASPQPVLRSPQSSVNSPQFLVLDGFFDLTRLEEQLVARLVKDAGQVLALSPVFHGLPEVTSPVQGFPEFLQSLVKVETVRLKNPRPPRLKPKYVRFPSREQEVEGIAADLKTRLLAKTLGPDEAIVVFPKFTQYAAIVRRVFAKYGIPFTLFPERMLAASPPLIAVLELLTATENNFPRVPFVAALTSPYFTRITATCRETVNRFSLAARLVKDRLAWQFLERRLRDEEPEMDEREQSLLRETQQNVNLVLGFCADYAQPGLERDNLTGFAGRLRALLARLGFGEKLDPARPEELELRNDQRLFYNVLESLAAFEHDFGPEQYSLAEFHHILTQLVKSTPAPPELERRGVLVSSTLETRGLDCRRLYYGGLTEDDFPTRFKHDPILPDSVRVRLNLPNLDRHSLWQHLHFLRLVNTPEDEPFLSFPDTDEGRLLLPCPFLDEESCIDPPEPAAVFTAEEQQRREGELQAIGYQERFEPLNLESEPEIVAEFTRRFGPDRVLAVTRLERYRRCPVLFYIETVLGIQALEEPRFEPQPADWGNILHRILERLYAEGVVAVKDIPERLRRIAPVVLQDFGLPAFWQQAVQRVLDELMPDFFALEQELRGEGFAPTKVERTVTASVFPDLRLRGRIDRIDASAIALRVLDYKSGGAADISLPAIRDRGTYLQLPLYAQMVQDQYPGKTIENLGIYGLRDMRVKWLAKKADVSELIEAALGHARAVIDAVRRAEFPPEPANRDDCSACPHNFICPRKQAANRQPLTAGMSDRSDSSDKSDIP
jgi:ATP-dependent helicase/DNAse subunit B